MKMSAAQPIGLALFELNRNLGMQGSAPVVATCRVDNTKQTMYTG